MSNSSIISGFRVVYDNDRDDDVVIDSNQKIQELLERQAREYYPTTLFARDGYKITL